MFSEFRFYLGTYINLTLYFNYNHNKTQKNRQAKLILLIINSDLTVHRRLITLIKL